MKGAEGWYTDPFGRHEARWMSNGRPTELVRDDGVESHDDPPDEPPSGTPVPIDDDPANADDLRRADDADQEAYDPQQAQRAVWDSFDWGPPS